MKVVKRYKLSITGKVSTSVHRDSCGYCDMVYLEAAKQGDPKSSHHRKKHSFFSFFLYLYDGC